MGEKNNDGENKKKANDGEKKKKSNDESVTVVLKVDMHCEGCASRTVKCVRGFEGVETVKSEAAAGKLTVTGNVDPAKLREKLEEKTKKKVQLVSPQPKKDKENAKDNNTTNKNGDDDKNKAKKSDDKKSDNDKKPKEKEPPVTTAVLKLNFHCQGCIGKIQRTVTKTKGVDAISMDKDKQLVTVKGTMDVKKLAETLSEKLRRPVEVVPPAKKDNGKDKDGGKEKKEGGGGGGDDGGKKEEGANKMEYVAAQPGSGFGYGYGYGSYYQYPVQAHAPQIFSDENPNACAVM
ncbi:PREDICTED: heavy metal-associated isoprenylated plant protein 3 [Tarenaya hassleriana]|uniref:heavy metal-associated isoprenylated plant protein 3 n=1 Tax=Tarenaya hassleriana TaxID=28532 RepID=UPI00053C2270|nr:PREDICTED: heavy metal-associated isoprenylated plant protein 3 [Tarenaya hassleriana]